MPARSVRGAVTIDGPEVAARFTWVTEVVTLSGGTG